MEPKAAIFEGKIIRATDLTKQHSFFKVIINVHLVHVRVCIYMYGRKHVRTHQVGTH
jgi:hypothetical protein